MAPPDGVPCTLVLDLQGWGAARSPDLLLPVPPRVGEALTVRERRVRADGRASEPVVARAVVEGVDHVLVQDDLGGVSVTVEVSARWAGTVDVPLGRVVQALGGLDWTVRTSVDAADPGVVLQARPAGR